MRATRSILPAVLAMLAGCTQELPESGPWFAEAKGLTYQPGCQAHNDALIRDGAAWHAFWELTHPDGEPTPAVDFERASVLAVCGALASPGHDYEITAWEATSKDRVTVHVSDVQPGDGCFYPAVVAFAFHAIMLEGTPASADFSHARAVRQACGTLGPGYGWTTLAQGQSSGCVQPVDVLIRTEDEWAAFWSTLHAPFEPAPARPAVDFANESVIATCLGARPTGGYATVVAHLTSPDEAGSITVGVRDLEPGAGCGVTQAVTQPYHVIRVNRVLSDATFRRRSSVLDCS